MSQLTRSYTFRILSFPFRFLWETGEGFWRVVSGQKTLPFSFWKKTALFHFAALIVVFGVSMSPYGVVYNPTPSEKIGVWFTSPLPDNLKNVDYGATVLGEYHCNLKTAKGDCLNHEAASVREGDQVIKRVLGKPGDVVSTEVDPKTGLPHTKISRANGEVYRSDFINLMTPSSKPLYFYPYKDRYTLPDGKYYLGNDRVPSSFDSRYYGPSDSSHILGQATFVFGL